MRSILPHRKKVAKWRTDPDAIEKYQFIHHFIPHPTNRTRARLLSQKALTVYCLIFLSILVGFKLFTHVYPGVLGYASDIKVKELLDLTNKKREEAGLKPLVLNEKLTEAAKLKASDMFKDGYWSHVAPDGTEPWDFILGEGYDYTYAGENLAKNFSNSRDVVEAWYNSSSHKENLLGANYDEIGFAVVDGVLDGYETTLVVQMFGRPREPQYLASVKDENRILESASNQGEQVVTVPGPVRSTSANSATELPVVLPALDVTLAVKGLGVLFISFLVALLGLDIWYSRRHSIAKLTGHSLAHLIFLIVSLVGMLFALMPGKIL